MIIDAGTLAAVFAGLNGLVTVGGGFYFMGRITAKMDAHETTTTRLQKDVDDMKGLIVSTAVDASRLNRVEADVHNLDVDVRNLRKGIGWINDPEAKKISREYK